jgi:hypothetical protein
MVEVAVGGAGVTEGPPGVLEGTGVLVGPPGVLVGTAVLVRVGVREGPPGVTVGRGVFVRVAVLVGAVVGTVVAVRVAVLVAGPVVAVAQAWPGRKISMSPAAVLGSYPPAIHTVLPSLSAGKLRRAFVKEGPVLQLFPAML